MRQSGLTLVEVLVALAILSIALTALILNTTENTRNIQYLYEKTAAHWVAMNVLNQVQLDMITPARSPSFSTGSMELMNTNWQWKLQIEITPDSSMNRIIVKVGHDEQPTLYTAYSFKEQLTP